MTQKIHLYIICISLLLLVAMAWHTFAFRHNHPLEFFGGGIQAMLHGEDKKWLLLAKLISFFTAFGILSYTVINYLLQTPRYGQYAGMYDTVGIAQYADPMKRAMQGGIMHPKLCA